MDLQLSGKTALVTGASQGIGRATANSLAAEGVQTAIAARRHELLNELADEIAQEAHEMTAFEDFVTECVNDGQSILGLYPATNEQTLVAFEAWRQANGR